MSDEHDNRISVSALDSYTYYRDSEQTIEEYVECLRRIDPPNPRAELGTLFHSYLEAWAEGVVHAPFEHCRCRECCGGFDLSGVNVTLERPVAQEVPIERLYRTSKGRSVLVRGRLDAIVRNGVVDYKTTKQPDMERYMDTYQWRVYLSIYPAEWFRYEIFKLGDERSTGITPVYEHSNLTLRPYAGMEDDVEARISEYDEFLRRLDADGYITLTENGVKPGIAGWQIQAVAAEVWASYYQLPDSARVGEAETWPLLTVCDFREDDYIRAGYTGEPGGAPLLMTRLYDALRERWPAYTVYVGTEKAEIDVGPTG